MTVDDVQRDVHYERFESRLKAVKSYWLKLSTLERTARKDPASVPRYRDWLLKGIDGLRAHDDIALTDDEMSSAVDAYFVKLDEYMHKEPVYHPDVTWKALQAHHADRYHAHLVAASAFSERPSTATQRDLLSTLQLMFIDYFGRM